MKVALVAFFSLMFVSEVLAEGFQKTDKETFMREFWEYYDSSPEDKESEEDSFVLSDVNGDGFLSKNEAKNLSSSLDIMENRGKNIGITDNEVKKAENQKKVLELFYDADEDGDNRLDESEWGVFFKRLQREVARLGIEARFAMMDRNQDGVIDEKDTPSMEESLEKIKENLERLKKATEDFDAEKAAEKMFSSIENAMDQEDFYQMDKDEDGCVSAKEYRIYHSGQSYDRYDAARDDCVTNEDYARDMASANISHEIALEIAKSVISVWDKNQDGCVSRAEYINSDFYYAEKYSKISKEKTDCLTEGEYIQASREEKARMLSGDVSDDIDDDEEEAAFAEFGVMDENKDGCVSGEEYVNYTVVVGGDDLKKKALREYEEIGKKTPSCLLRDEYFSYVEERQRQEFGVSDEI